MKNDRRDRIPNCNARYFLPSRDKGRVDGSGLSLCVYLSAFDLSSIETVNLGKSQSISFLALFGYAMCW